MRYPKRTAEISLGGEFVGFDRDEPKTDPLQPIQVLVLLLFQVLSLLRPFLVCRFLPVLRQRLWKGGIILVTERILLNRVRL